MLAGFTEFEFDLPGALLNNLINILDGVAPAQLESTNVAAIPEDQGVYQILLDGAPVYVGKTDAQAGLNKRLTRHSRKILHRQGLDPSRVGFKAVRIYVFTAVDLEGDLIRYYGTSGGLAWNGGGFGSNDPGRQRDTTRNKPANYDYQYPIDIDRPIEEELSQGSAAEMLRTLRGMLPYAFRIEGQARHTDLRETIVPALPAPYTARQAVQHIVNHVPPGWQATKLLGYIIMYKESRVYPQSEVVARS